MELRITDSGRLGSSRCTTVDLIADARVEDAAAAVAGVAAAAARAKVPARLGGEAHGVVIRPLKRSDHLPLVYLAAVAAVVGGWVEEQARKHPEEPPPTIWACLPAENQPNAVRLYHGRKPAARPRQQNAYTPPS